jgi:hypothetical protein
VARKDGAQGAQAVLHYLATLPPVPPEVIVERQEVIRQHLQQLGHPVVTKEDWQRLELAEEAEAVRIGLEAFKYGHDDEMLQAMGLLEPATAGETA